MHLNVLPHSHSLFVPCSPPFSEVTTLLRRRRFTVLQRRLFIQKLLLMLNSATKAGFSSTQLLSHKAVDWDAEWKEGMWSFFSPLYPPVFSSPSFSVHELFVQIGLADSPVLCDSCATESMVGPVLRISSICVLFSFLPFITRLHVFE